VAGALHPAENRGYRELGAFTRALVEHWPALADRLGPGDAADVLRSGAGEARVLLAELGEVVADYGLHAGTAAQGVGRWLAGTRNVAGDRFLERNQALRFAVGEAQHLSTLLGYLACVAEARKDEGLTAFSRRWERRIRRTENAVRAAAIELGGMPDAAIEPVDTGPAGRAAHGLGFALGSVGEWVDRRIARDPRPG
jgi:hypothetical protein